MGSPLSPILANLYMEFFEETALKSTETVPSLWLRYVDDTFVIWPHGEDTLPGFLKHLNSIQSSIQFTMEKESGGSLSFLDVLVTRDQRQGKFRTTVYRKPTHTERYLHFDSYHPPHVKTGIIRTLVHRSKVISHDSVSHSQEVKHLTDVFKCNGYPQGFIKRAVTKSKPTQMDERLEPKATVSIPYVRGVSEKLRRICRKANIRVCFKSNRTIRSIVMNVKPRSPPEDTKGVIYRIPCQDCNKSYYGETGRTLKVRLTEHKRYCRNGETNRSGVSQHTLIDNHRIDWNKSSVVAKEPNYYKRKIKEALFIRKFHNMNQDQGLTVSPIWSVLFK